MFALHSHVRARFDHHDFLTYCTLAFTVIQEAHLIDTGADTALYVFARIQKVRAVLKPLTSLDFACRDPWDTHRGVACWD